MPVSNDVRERLLRLADHYESADFIVGDPSWWMHQVVGKHNQEAMAFLASCLSYGSRKQFMPKIGQLLEWSGGEVHRWVAEGAFEDALREDDDSCFYRLYSKKSMNALLRAYRQMLTDFGSMGLYVHRNASDGLAAIQSLCGYFGDKGASVVEAGWKDKDADKDNYEKNIYVIREADKEFVLYVVFEDGTDLTEELGALAMYDKISMQADKVKHEPNDDPADIALMDEVVKAGVTADGWYPAA
jgi:hypothetical protein